MSLLTYARILFGMSLPEPDKPRLYVRKFQDSDNNLWYQATTNLSGTDGFKSDNYNNLSGLAIKLSTWEDMPRYGLHPIPLLFQQRQDPNKEIKINNSELDKLARLVEFYLRK